jgi:hypothetical protein
MSISRVRLAEFVLDPAHLPTPHDKSIAVVVNLA